MQRDSTQKNWDEFWNRKQHVEEVYSNVERIITNLRRVTALNGKRILEVGAGTARDSFKLVNQGANVFVLDYSPVAMDIVNHLNQENNTKIQPIRADAFSIPSPDNTYDIVFHQGLLEHFRDPRPLLQENVRVLKEGGYLLVDVPQRYHIYTIIKHILIFFNKWFAGWETEFSINELENLAKHAGVKVVYRYGSWMRPSLFYRILREVLLKIKIKLPLYPRGLPLFRNIRNFLRNRFIHSNWALYTFLDIGIIAKKDNSNGK